MLRILRSIHPSWQITSLLTGVLFGAIFAAIFQPIWFISGIWYFVSAIILLAALILSRKFCLILTFFSGVLLILTRAGPVFVAKDSLEVFLGQTVSAQGLILKSTNTEDGKLNLNLTDFEICMEQCRKFPETTVFVQARSEAKLMRSDRIVISGQISEGFGNFDAAIFRAEITSISRGNDVFLGFRDWFAGIIRRFIPEPEVNLGLGYLLGDKSGVEQEFQDTLSMIGLTHIIVASGAHLSTIIGLTKRIFGKVSRFAAMLFALLLMISFICVTGLSASMLRAGIVTGLSLIAWYFGRKFAAWRILLIAAGATLLYNPRFITELGWLLSFMSFAGIMLVAPKITQFFYSERKKPGVIASTIISSLSANILCAPITLYFFGSISIISLLANVLILPTISVAMGLTFLTGVGGLLFTPIGDIVGVLTTWLLKYQIAVVNFCGTQTQFLIEIEPENPLVFIWYLVVTAVAVMIFWQKNHKSDII